MSQGLVLYGDGGYRALCGGYGIHGYLYDTDKPKKSSGNSEHALTAMGYVTKNNKSKEEIAAVEVTPIHYVDGYGSLLPPTTNNVAELLATLRGLEHARKYDITDLQFFTDSEYVRKGLELWVDTWKKNNWLKNDQTEPANVVIWKELVSARDTLIERGVNVKINWVKGHSDKNPNMDDVLGNILADRLATAGVMCAISKKIYFDIATTEATGYWKYNVEKHPFISHRRMYFNTLVDCIRPGEYYLGDHGKDDDMLGKKISDGAYSVVSLKTPEEVLEIVRNHQSNISGGIDSIVMVRLDHLYRPNTHKELMTFRNNAMEKTIPYRLDLFCLDREPLTRELSPPKLAMRAVESLNELAFRMGMFINKDPLITVTDITDVLYEVTSKTDKKNIVTTSIKLRPEFVVGYSALHVNANYETTKDIKSVPVTLTLGMDLLDRNALKRIEDMNPKVTLITWLEASEIFRYATVTQTGDDICINAGVYSNLRIVAP